MSTAVLQMLTPVLLSGITFIYVLKFRLFEFISIPLDVGLKWRHVRLLGDNKTLRGPFVMGVATSIYGVLLHVFWSSQNSYIDGMTILSIWFGYLLVGLAYSFGELPNSFVKRQIGINPGAQAETKSLKGLFYIFDTFDSLVMCGLVYVVYFSFPVKYVLLSVLIGGILHLLTDRLMVLLGLK